MPMRDKQLVETEQHIINGLLRTRLPDPRPRRDNLHVEVAQWKDV